MVVRGGGEHGEPGRQEDESQIKILITPVHLPRDTQSSSGRWLELLGKHRQMYNERGQALMAT